MFIGNFYADYHGVMFLNFQENILLIKFGIRQRMRCGKTVLNHTQFLGYTKGKDGVLQIVPEEAEIVRKIFELYVQGNGVRKIKRYLEECGIKTVTGKAEWSTSTIDRMLSNEKYIGQVLMQKTYTPDFLTGRQEKNRGQLEVVLVENAHEPIIEPAVFEKVQEMKGCIKLPKISEPAEQERGDALTMKGPF